MPLLIDASVAPLVVVRASGRVTMEDGDQYCEAALSDFGLTEPYMVILIEKDAEGFGFRERHNIGRRLAKHAHRDDALDRGAALVVSSQIIRGILTAVLWTIAPKQEVKFFNDEDKAFAWAKERMKKLETSNTPPVDVTL